MRGLCSGDVARGGALKNLEPCGQDGRENLKPAKDKSADRIDGIVATIMALGRAAVYSDRLADRVVGLSSTPDRQTSDAFRQFHRKALCGRVSASTANRADD